MSYFSLRGRHRHEISVLRRFASMLLLPMLLVCLSGFALTGFTFMFPSATDGGVLALALGASVLRLLISYALALVVGVALGLLAEANPRLENFLLPIYDVMEALPVLAFFPILILFFIDAGFAEGAAIFVIFFTIVWTIAFSTIGGLKQIPQDVLAVGRIFGLNFFGRLRHIVLPALFPSLVTASILSIADGWNLVIVAEVLHAYAPSGRTIDDLFGIGSLLVAASTSGDTPLVIASMSVLVVFIAAINFWLWQPLLSRAEQYKFEV